ncbi:hypothetical protein [Pseudoalteromonas luteoviolacea]|uniref:Uncharacterized protein n=1 Tax=Pseudoalteromonas luteoviolacea S4054 TaxID=1129367 RepID=A0A0F6AGT6_9GAMM|nr:hypothetical protein [Pseudoalteromonas luteoviolacea]AOT09274.1 hypothetical protein S4054249_16095 [Pseudoalteromonas luteoviolacea]AOT14186.1 hypothetical protein S40542_16065 [Pseudoalteromonas luteoviolacea]AOT19102.1 hypothetical protein S4054_16070 [Pseudoalteromonas luteoviolacea]KKE85011.1 hypothetical protein N479_06150 [Pseudoalteromonas luteoviolacea S4054]KZN70129.1 hypothetical protein N481_01260 [Pseudoalteromonas luteoviolacea S4047-1]
MCKVQAKTQAISSKKIQALKPKINTKNTKETTKAIKDNKINKKKPAYAGFLDTNISIGNLRYMTSTLFT